MTRYLAVAAVVTALAIPASADARVRYLEGTAVPQGGIAFYVKVRDGHPRKVTDFSWWNIPGQCDDGPTDLDGHFDFPMWVLLGVFHGKGEARDERTGKAIGYAKVTGELRHRAKSASGTIRISGDVPDFGTSCETTRLDWSAVAQ